MKTQREVSASCAQIQEISFALHRLSARLSWRARSVDQLRSVEIRNQEICSLSLRMILCLLRLFAVISEQLAF